MVARMPADAHSDSVLDPTEQIGNERTILEARGLEQSFRMGSTIVEVLRGVDLQIVSGERVFLCGASGAGKTTLLYTLAGLERPKGGEVILEGRSLYRNSASRQADIRNRKMGYVFQSYFLMPELTALENVLLPSFMNRSEREEAAVDMMRQLGVDHRLAHLPAELSGGEQQRVAIARALVNDPEIVFADEPTGNLDSVTGGEVMDALLNVVAARKKTLIVVTHDSTVAGLGDRQLDLADGRIVD